MVEPIIEGAAELAAQATTKVMDKRITRMKVLFILGFILLVILVVFVYYRTA